MARYPATAMRAFAAQALREIRAAYAAGEGSRALFAPIGA